MVMIHHQHLVLLTIIEKNVETGEMKFTLK